MTLDLATATADDFEPQLESTFTAEASEVGTFPLTLVDVRTGASGSAREQFTLTFAGGPNPAVPQGILHLEHDALGELDVFLVPVGPGKDGRHRYEAVFA